VHKYTNQLIRESSPYLLQHAHNPVNWYPWGDEALRLARELDRPILVSIGYAACHWCHVMERESFEDEATAAMMNEHFINIKIDREERPDLDHIYMDAVQAMTGSGGWPLNVFLTPEARPFYGGTYFPPQRAFNRASWKEVLEGVSQAFRDRRHEIDAQAENLTDHLLKANSFGLQQAASPDQVFDAQKTDEAFANCMKSADRTWGGFGRAPKFPQSFTIQFLLRYYHCTSRKEALDQALLSIDKMIQGGIYDQVGGGFARYSTDTEWLAPHFEKMLYDNALLISLLSEAYQLTHEARYREVITETMEFVRRELQHPLKPAFYSALDADSEGEEGKFYTWSLAEVRSLLGADADIFCLYFDISEKGNWEDKNILRVKKPLQEFAGEHQLGIDQLRQIIDRGKKTLLQARTGRVRPQLDDKVLLGWNALMNTACSKAFMVTHDPEYRDLAVANMQFLLDNMRDPGPGGFFHTWKNDRAKYPAFLDDYSFLVQALIQLQEITGDTQWLTRARQITEFVIDQFSEPETGYFFYTGANQPDVIIRKKEIYDGATPSGNAVMAHNLYELGIVFDEPGWKERSVKMLAPLAGMVSRYPTSFGVWASLLQEMNVGTWEVAVVGKDGENLRSGLFDLYLPHRVLMSAITENQDFPLLLGKGGLEGSWIYLCKDYACQQPVESIERFIALINRSETLN
jgi:uncharacterized protein YyaL (SSP411 family)